MSKTISSKSTFVFKYVVPAIWAPLGVLAAMAVFRNPHLLTTNGTLPSVAAQLLFTTWLVASAIGIRSSLRLKRVRVEDGALLVSNYVREWRIPFALIESVSQVRWHTGQEITIRLRADVGCGTTVTFEPPRRRGFRFGREDPQVGELRELVGLVAVGEAPIG